MLLTQKAAPNSPQWFNTGLQFAYGMTGPSQGHWYVNPKTNQLEREKPPTRIHAIRNRMPALSEKCC